MKHIFLIIILLAFFSSCSSLKFKGSVKLTHLKGGVYLVEDTYYSKENSVVYIGKEEVTVISATWTPSIAKELHKKIELITNKPIRYVVNPNFHPDRTGGNMYFKLIGAKIIATSITKSMMRLKWKERVVQMQNFDPTFPDIPLIYPDITFLGNLSLNSNKVELHYLGESHTAGGLVVYFPEEKILYAGCILKEKKGNLEDANISEYRKVLEKLKKFDAPTIISGHFSAIHGPSLINKFLDFLR